MASGRWLRGSFLPRVAGPLLIFVAVLIVLHRFWFHPRLTSQHVDLLSYWLPRWCFLGHSIRAGHLPTWLPYQVGGVPFASDPQSGWLDAPVMLFFSRFSCARAMGLMVVLHPLLAGLGMYLFFRHEGVGRPAATVGGLTLSMAIVGSVVVLTMPFAGTLAWTAMALAGASGYLRSRTPARTLTWLGFTAFALSQAAAAHLTNGFLMAAVVVAVYVLLRSMLQVTDNERSAGLAFLMGVGLFAAFPLLAAATLLPRLAFLPRTSLGHGYLELGRLATKLSGARAPLGLAFHGLSPWWGTAFARGPGGYVGVLGILLIPLALTSPKWKLPAIGFAVVGLAAWALNLDVLISSKAVRSAALDTPVGELWLRDPGRFRYLALFAFSAAAGYGLQAWLDLDTKTRSGATMTLLWLLPAAGLFVLLPILAGSGVSGYVVFAVAALATIPLLILAARFAAWPALAVVVVAAAELTAAGLLAQQNPAHGTLLARSLRGPGKFGHAFASIRPPNIEPGAYVTPGTIGQALIAGRGSYGRYLSFDPEISRQSRAFLGHQAPASWPAYENGRSVLFGISEIQGYLPVQLDRYWRLVRKVDPVPLLYNHAAFQSLDPELLRLFAVKWVIQRTDLPPPDGTTPVTDEGRYTLYLVGDAQPRASMVYRWRRLGSDAALSAAVQTKFDPAQEAIVETTPLEGRAPLRPAASPRGTATYSETSPEHVVVHVTGNSDGLVVVRNAYDRNWRATVDGQTARVIVADYMMQAVAVPAGDHVVVITYRDRALGLGVAVSALAWGLLVVAIVALLAVGRWSGRRVEPGPAKAAGPANVSVSAEPPEPGS